MILLGFIGIYVGLIFQEVKRRPIYLVRQQIRGPRPDSFPQTDEPQLPPNPQ
jgi:dolichol-phosphate mannosyltransferase